jgi:hypothetical protein
MSPALALHDEGIMAISMVLRRMTLPGQQPKLRALKFEIRRALLRGMKDSSHDRSERSQPRYLDFTRPIQISKIGMLRNSVEDGGDLEVVEGGQD